ncbi:FecR family protein [Cyanobium sp. CH-040]|uniref:FecR family protein n=1 Tax=Cyanobium sp. CH-040 TaxID=2823708 RepID=UPI0020CBF959|nr:FecR family protein [Cyanobium sp. CH-040]
MRPPKVVDVPTRPAFVKLPGRVETPARTGQGLLGETVLRTATPGRLQVQLPDGRSFRLGGDAVLRLAGSTLDLQRGQIIAWVNPGRKGGTPLRVRTRVATASIVGTTVFIEATDTEVRVFSWEGAVQVSTDAGQQVTLNSGEQLSYLSSPTADGEQPGWQPPRRLSRAELDSRRARSILLNGFAAPMETLPVIEKELGFSR